MELVEEFLNRYRQGERPPLMEYIDRHPELAAEIRDLLPTMAVMESIALAAGFFPERAQRRRSREVRLKSEQWPVS